ncbi:hypothetical protein J7S33_31835 [Saccharothrix algeriensis]|uniref:Peptidoglycan/LPS O-acetylase OafA/YrhL n=1 Tax=Saccharothrix algeriensis TaxID=173560 RepID=A0A8T8HYI0_9PSEU|nr:peptidoglycan/LPS O-acetylase OafA/YrhL [Saccharothrix algeriensis]QTR03439.1 hypothetical protein J7S33_31835 [Saccharothrix algeriensis]
MSQPFPSDPSTPGAAEPRAKKHVGIIVLLVLLTLSNAALLLIGVVEIADQLDRSRSSRLPALLFGALLSAVALAGLVGAWMTRKWGPRLYAAMAALGLVVGLVLTEGSFSPLSLVGVGLAALLWVHAETNW